MSETTGHQYLLPNHLSSITVSPHVSQVRNIIIYSAHPKSWVVSDSSSLDFAPNLTLSGPVESQGRVGTVLVLSDLFAQLFLHLPQLLAIQNVA